MAGFFKRFKDGLKKTASVLNTPLQELVRNRRVDDAFWEELEEALILSDLGPTLALETVGKVRTQYQERRIREPGEILSALQKQLTLGVPTLHEMKPIENPHGPTVILMIGVNGTGKTTTTAKLAQFHRSQGRSVLLGAADTFRAAAGEQLDIWAQRLGVDIVRHQDGADPAAVVYDTCEAAKARDTDVVIIDTAGRLHNKANLMNQLEKIHRVAGKLIEGAPHEVLLVLDATNGQNALSQAKLFSQGVGATGLVLTKLDGTAKGGVVIAINQQIRLPIKFIGTGETVEDFAPFDPEEFCAALFASAAAAEA